MMAGPNVHTHTHTSRRLVTHSRTANRHGVRKAFFFSASDRKTALFYYDDQKKK